MGLLTQNATKTGKHFSRMCTARLPTIHALATQCQYCWEGVGGWAPQVNKFEQVSSGGHQMSLAEWVPCLMSKVPCLKSRGWALYSEVQCILGNGHMGTPLWTDRDTCENITFLQFRWRAVKIGSTKSKEWVIQKGCINCYLIYQFEIGGRGGRLN